MKKPLLPYMLIAFIWGLGFWGMPMHDPDLSWHLLAGKWILANNSVPSTDFINAFAKTWIDYHWLSQILFYLCYKIGGFFGLRVLLGILMGILSSLVMATVAVQWRGKEALNVAVLISFFAAMYPIGALTSIRPHVIALITIAISQIVVLSKTSRTKQLLALFFLTALTANIHVYWIFIPFIWVSYRIFPRCLDREELAPLYVWGGFFLLALSGTLSPYGFFGKEGIFSNYYPLYEYFTMSSELKKRILELKPLFAAGGSMPSVIFFCALAIASKYSIKRACAQYKIIFPALILLFLTLGSLKFASLLSLFSIYPLTKALLMLRRTAKKTIPLPVRFFERSFFLWLVLLVVSLRAYFNSPWVYENSFFFDEELPIKECSKIPSLADGRSSILILTHFNYGGWCKWAIEKVSPGFPAKITTDGRTHIVPDTLILADFDLYNLQGRWTETLSKWNPDFIIAHKSSPLAQFLLREIGGWETAVNGAKFALFKKRSAPKPPSAG